ncbi:gliding motility-associated C-terminal domain-containing protein [Aquirufa ecclesiirivi]|uniref:gliding motility-associated C-terminal domain-containing protein n=1 Tax=Aquirufa ecclesiirivi TaxID=2715124 RepID=UPI0023D8734E|nr:gliding motility-associated C-terminal domain-containing protein [Aquirufa ecclesiirivi]MDF0693137.1 gliding motility-associated C-terminal domain-containing protein [Aquirufa ecclesiirivi]
MNQEVLANKRFSSSFFLENTSIGADSSLNGKFVIPSGDKNKFRTENLESIGIIPQGITPNGDGKNDKLVIDGILGLKNKLSIFNRWGNIVFEKENYTNDWGGEYLTSESTSDGKLLPDGIYYYVIDFYGQKENISTYVLINRLAVK